MGQWLFVRENNVPVSHFTAEYSIIPWGLLCTTPGLIYFVTERWVIISDRRK